MLKRSSLFLLLPLGLGWQDAPPTDPVIDGVIKAGRTDNRVMEHLDHLTNKIGPRLTGSDNLTKACEWARDRFASWGLKVRMEEWGTYPVAYNRRGWSGRMLAPERKELLFGFNAWTPGTNGPVAGHAVIAPATGEELAAVRRKLKGAWVVSEGRMTKGELAERIKKAYDEERIAGYVRSSNGDLIQTGGHVPVSFDALPTRVNITLHSKAHKEVVGLLKAGKEVKLEFDLKNEFKKGPVPLYNVIADIPGTEKPDEYVIVGGHIDSWDGATGTTDNGTGSATTLEAARLLVTAGAKPKRTIRFMLWSAEEQGLLGSKAYVRQHPDEMAKISAVLVHDGGTNYLSGIGVTAAMMEDAQKVFARMLTLDPAMPFTITETKGLTKVGGSDHVAFRQAGVPGFFWKQDGRQVYEHEHHTQYDTFDSAVAEYEKHSSMVAAIGAWGIANLDHLLPRAGMEDVGEEKPRRRLGIQFGERLGVEGVDAGSPADRAGIKEGDQILTINGVDVKSNADVKEEVRKGPKEMPVGVRRDGRDLVITVTFPDRGAIRRQALGIQLGGDEGLDVVEVTAGSVAAKAGLEVGDRILKIGETPIDAASDLWVALDKAPKKTTVTVSRKGKDKVLDIEFDS